MLLQLAASDAPDQILLGPRPQASRIPPAQGRPGQVHDGGVVDEQIPDSRGPDCCKPGMKDERVPLLRQRLDVAEPGNSRIGRRRQASTITYDEALVAAVKAFQESLGLTADGVLGPATVAALNGGSADDQGRHHRQYGALALGAGGLRRLPRLREHPRIPAVRSWITASRVPTRPASSSARRRTRRRVFSDEIEHIVVNPYWNVPPSIATNEIKPHLLANPGYLDSQNMELLSGGKVVNASAIDWSTTNINNFHIRQRPGAGNALGQIKFLFPNQHDVYLHDTPSKSLFARSYRAYSHGCVRVQNPMDFAGALTGTRARDHRRLARRHVRRQGALGQARSSTSRCT